MHSTDRSRLIASIATKTAVPPEGHAFVIEDSPPTPQQIQAARRHIYCLNNEGPVAIHRATTPEGHPALVALPNHVFQDRFPSAPPLPTSQVRKGLLPLPAADLPPTIPFRGETPDAPRPPTPGRGPGEPGRRAAALQRPPLRGLTGKVTDSPGAYGYYSTQFPEAEVRSVRTPAAEAGTYLRFHKDPDDTTPAPIPEGFTFPEWVCEPTAPQRPRRKRAGPDTPGWPVLSNPKVGTTHLFIRPDVLLSNIPAALRDTIYTEGHLNPRQRQKIPWDLSGAPTDRYVPIPEALQGDPEVLKFQARAGKYLVYRNGDPAPLPNRHCPACDPLPVRPADTTEPESSEETLDTPPADL